MDSSDDTRAMQAPETSDEHPRLDSSFSVPDTSQTSQTIHEEPTEAASPGPPVTTVLEHRSHESGHQEDPPLLLACLELPRTRFPKDPERTSNTRQEDMDGSYAASLPSSETVKPTLMTKAGYQYPSNTDPASQAYVVPVLYRLSCNDQDRNTRQPKIDRYSKTPFDGLEVAGNRETLSVMDVNLTVWGSYPPDGAKRTNQAREHFGTNQLADNDKPFVLGTDFIIRMRTPKQIRIMSKAVIEFIRSGLPYYPDKISDEEYCFSEPYKPLVFNYQRMAAAVGGSESNLYPIKSSNTGTDTPAPSNTLIAHLKIVLEWIEGFYRTQIMPELSKQQLRKVTYDKLWLLFPPGTIVSTRDDSPRAFYVVQSLEIPLGSNKEPVEYWKLRVWGLDIVSKKLMRCEKLPAVRIPRFSEDRDIATLPLIPLDFLDADQKMKMRSRGRRFLELYVTAPTLRRYDGALSGNQSLTYSGAVIVDSPDRSRDRVALGTIVRPSDSALAVNPQEIADGGGGARFMRFNDAPVSQTLFEEEEDTYLLLPCRIWGFVLGKKQWAHLDITSFIKDTPKHDISENLVIDQKNLALIKAIAYPDPPSIAGNAGHNDFVEGKGCGKVVLLHGPSGVGKTFTVECLADHMKRPLLALTAADIGTDQSYLEQKLSGWLDLAQRWNALVLLDEADTYLEKRANKELSRNSFVTAFLRVLEYYPGTIFLTSNRPGKIDDAFISRVHLCIQYKKMSANDLDSVWAKFFSWAAKSEGQDGKPYIRIPGLYDYVQSASVQRMCPSGRDIRNAFQTAMKIAAQRVPRAQTDGKASEESTSVIELHTQDVKDAIENKIQYQSYHQSIDGRTEDERAHESQDRAMPESAEKK